ncbi:FR47-like protein domain-containing protein [Phthorimaea operculella]|nr:FR47-like protein domain-containing protein [Phthorimaea operculella]
MSLDALVHLPVNDWDKLQKAFEADWPRGISGYTILETQRKWKAEGFDYGFKVFCPFGVVQNGMVAINEKDVFYEIVIQCPNEDTTNLEEALLTTKEINWSRDIVIPFAPNHVIECVKRVVKALNLNLHRVLPSESFILDKHSCPFHDVGFPPSITYGLLTHDHIDLVDSKWPHRYPGSTWYFKLLIRTKSGFGLFKDSQLISWVFINEAGTLGHMYTLEEHRRRGYALLLLKLVCNKLLSEGKDVFAFAVKGNNGAYIENSDIPMDEDSFRELSVEKWAELKQEFKSNWPRGITGYYALDTLEKWLKQDLSYGFKVLSAFGELKSGMIVVLKEEKDFSEWLVECPHDDTTRLSEALRSTKQINWDKDIIILFPQKHIVDCIKRTIGDIGVKLDWEHRLKLYLLPKETQFYDVSLPQGFVFKQLTDEYLEIYDSTWPHRYPGSIRYFDLLIKSKSGYGLFKEDQLVSFGFVKEMGALGHLFTLEEHRRKGYGEIVTKLICNELLKQGNDVFSFCIDENVNSCNMHDKLGFLHAMDVYTIKLSKNTNIK